MQKDFHYCCIRFLSSAAGFEEEDAQVIAYACQYVDDATENKGIRIRNLPDVARDMVTEGKFEPICTAHRGIQYLSGLSKDVQRKVYIPFHFVPAEPYGGEKSYDYRVRPNAPFPRSLVNSAAEFYREARNDEQKLRGLIKLGISLHAYGDSWSHRHFSGRWNAGDNDIERIRVWNGDKWEPVTCYNILPDIGHAEALELPDQTHLTWQYEHDRSGRVIYRHNTEESLHAAETIYNLLCSINGLRPDWKSLMQSVRECFELPTDSLKKKFDGWKRHFPEVNFSYNPEEWRTDALTGERYDWEHFMTAEDFGVLEYEATGDLKWFFFHAEAKRQRETVIRQIREDLL
ncbi:hypothetical protein QUF72_02010 [Desulfobacterales bacterium HSG2]|nr:hypothetical protein [Desulfobacterales bacterium HSG2]